MDCCGPLRTFQRALSRKGSWSGRCRAARLEALEDRTEIDARVAPGMRVAVGERRGCGAVRCGLRHAFAASLATVLIETPSSAAMSLCVLSRPMRSRIRHSRSVKG